MKITHTDKNLQSKAFTYYIKDYNSRKRLYTLENPLTKDIKIITKEEFDALYGAHMHEHLHGHENAQEHNRY